MATNSEIWTKFGVVFTAAALFFGIFISRLTLEWKAISIIFVWLATSTFYFDHRIKRIEISKEEGITMGKVKDKIDEVHKLLKSKKASIDPVVLILIILAFIFLVLVFLQGK